MSADQPLDPSPADPVSSGEASTPHAPPTGEGAPAFKPDTDQVLGLVSELEERLGRLKDWQKDHDRQVERFAEHASRVEGQRAELERFKQRLDEERADLLDRQDALAAKAATVGDFLAEIEAELRALRVRLPEPLAEDLATVYQRVPKEPAETTLSLGERMRTVVTLLGRVRQFDGKLTVAESIRSLPGREGEASVRTLYLGLGQAYYLAPDDAGVGRPGPEGWTWESRPQFENAIREAMLLAEGGAREPKFVDLPVRIENGEEGER